MEKAIESVKVILAIFLLIALIVPANARQYGQITGKIEEAATGMELPGANISLQGTSLGAASDINGRYLVPRVPVGTYEVVVSYLGYTNETATVSVGAGEKVVQDFSLNQTTVAGEEVVVYGSRTKGQALALNQQKNAPNIKNIVASDQMGRFPDVSAPEAVQRIPGISVQRDMGEGRYIQIRGGSPRMTSVTFNGERVPSPEGDERQIALDAVPVDILESIEVSKAITPDMDADAIGGSVNLVTKTAPEEQVLRVETAGGYSPIREKFSPNGSVTYGNRFNDGKLGLLASVSASRRDFGANDLEPDYELEDPGLADDQLSELQVRHYSLWRARYGATAKLDYKLNNNSFFYLNGIYTELQDNEQRRRLIQNVEDGELEFNHKSRLEKLKSMNFTAGGEHLFGSGYQLDYHFTVTKSEEDTPDDVEIAFLQEDVSFNPTISDADNIKANPGSQFVNGPYIFDKIEPASSLTEDTDYIGAANFKLPYRLMNTVGNLKLGFKYRDKKKTQDVVESEYELADGADDIILGSGIGDDFDFSNYDPGDYPFPLKVTSEEEVEDFVKKNNAILEREEVIDADVEDFEATEKVLALYAMTEINFTPEFMLLPGVRYEQTDVEATGKEYDSETEEITPSTAEKSYSKLFPMIHARYRLAPRTNIRAAFTSVLARPNYYDMAPFRLRDDEDLELGNPNLDPTYAYNYDLMFEHYAQTIGIISVGAFYKQINDPIFVFISDNELGGETEQSKNGESGNISGFEFALQRQLNFLPAPFDGLGLYGNYTYTTSTATLPGGRDAKFSGQPDNVFNIALNYEKAGFSGQLSFNYHDNFVLEYGETAEEDLFVNTHFQIDLSANYQISPSLNVFFEMVNLTNEPYRTYLGSEERPYQLEYYKPWGRLGIRYSL
ncbi:TonB-dependent receptor [candidate division KSB1 bacterium]|nr:TonB-dependent receptor [candidate division KSB1 bacterium]